MLQLDPNNARQTYRIQEQEIKAEPTQTTVVICYTCGDFGEVRRPFADPYDTDPCPDCELEPEIMY